MGLDVKIQHKKSFILATYSGDFDLKDAIRIYKEVLSAALEEKESKILLDYREIKGRLSFIDRFTYAEETTKYWMDFIRSSDIGEIKIAHMGKPPIVDPEKFGELVAKNRGACNLKVFEDIKEAKRWLGIEDT